MLYDHIHNINTYASLSPDILVGLEFLRDAKPDIANGVYQLNPRVKAIVSEYETKPQNPNGYEAVHRHTMHPAGAGTCSMSPHRETHRDKALQRRR